MSFIYQLLSSSQAGASVRVAVQCSVHLIVVLQSQLAPPIAPLVLCALEYTWHSCPKKATYLLWRPPVKSRCKHGIQRCSARNRAEHMASVNSHTC